MLYVPKALDQEHCRRLIELYETGELSFPEYGPELYCPDTGGAVVFSCYGVHGVRAVAEGRRFVLLAFCCGAEGEAQERPVRVA